MNRVTDEVAGELREELDEKDKIIMALVLRWHRRTLDV
jgi:hypothetical protein